MIINFKKQKHSWARKTTGGYTIVELLFYIALFAILTFAVINSLITMTKAFRETSIQLELSRGSAIMERISREIRKAGDISSISANDLILNTKDDAGADKTLEFLLFNSNLELLENSVLTGNLNAPNVTVTAVTFTQITTAKGKAVKILLSIKSNNDVLGRVVDFYDTVVLRGGY